MGLLRLLALAAGLAQAQTTIHATVDKTAVALNDQITLTVTVAGAEASLPEPQMPPLPNFSVYSSGRNQSITFVNGRVSSSINHTYVLEPRFVGRGVIGPITLAGIDVRTAPIGIQVVKPENSGAQASGGPVRQRPQAAPARSRAPGGAADLFVKAELEKNKAFVNEQVNLSIKFFTAVNLLGNPQYIPPKTAGFLAEDLPPVRQGSVVLGGRNYYVSEVKTALFPAQSGKLGIGPATVRAQIQKDVQMDPFAADFFNKFFSSGLVEPQTRDLNSEPLLLTAEPLPEGKPGGFSGAVGNFSISAAVDKTKVKIGEAVNLTVTVQGTGNLKAMGDPVMAGMEAFRVYDTVSSFNLDKKNDRVQGSKVFKTVLVPRVSGDLAVPAISFSFFNPQRRAYSTVATLPLRLSVEASAAGSPAAAFDASGAVPQQLRAVSSDIRYLKTGQNKAWLTLFLEAIHGAGLFHAVPFLVFFASLALTAYRKMENSNPQGARASKAWKTASGRLSKARQAMALDPARAAGLVSEAFSGYLADRLGVPAAGLTWRRAQELLRLSRPQPRPELLERLRRIWEELDSHRFAPEVDGRKENLPEAVAGVLEELEKELRR